MIKTLLTLSPLFEILVEHKDIEHKGAGPPMKQHTTQRGIDRAERQERCLNLRRQGHTIREIAGLLDVSANTVWRDLKAAITDIPRQEAEELRQQEVQRLDNLQRAIWETATSGDLQAVDRCVRIIERRCKLLGLDLPPQMSVSADIDVDLDDAVAKIMDAAFAAADAEKLKA